MAERESSRIRTRIVSAAKRIDSVVAQRQDVIKVATAGVAGADIVKFVTESPTQSIIFGSIIILIEKVRREIKKSQK